MVGILLNFGSLPFKAKFSDNYPSLGDNILYDYGNLLHNFHVGITITEK